MRSSPSFWGTSVALLATWPLCAALKAHDFRKCGDTPFCRLHRTAPDGTWSVNATTVSFSANVLTAQLVPPSELALALPLAVTLSVLKTGAVRVHMDEDKSLPVSSLEHTDPAVAKPAEWDDDMDGDWDAPMVRLGRAVKQRFEAASYSFASSDAAAPATDCTHREAAAGDDRLVCSLAGGGGRVEVQLLHSPLAIRVLDASGKVAAALNGRGLLRFEPFHEAIASETAEAPAEASSSYTFNGFTDPMKFGASSVGLDVDFPQATHAYGLPERTVAHDLPPTVGAGGRQKEPYRLFNLDVFEYELDHPMSVYGSVPFLHAHGDGGSYGLLFLNPSETFVDMGCDGAIFNLQSAAAASPAASGTDGVCSHWLSASGVVDAFIFVGATPSDVTSQHAALTGTSPLPPLFALGYHQCRWNYRDEDDVSRVHAAFEEHDLPFDVLWLDIEHTNGKRYFTWDPSKFGTPEAMQRRLAHTGRKMVTIIDPHLKASDDYPVFTQARDQQLLVRKGDNVSHFEGDCWPGRSAWVDYLLPEARAYWASRFAPSAYEGATRSLYTWNDMNEPSVFDGPEITMPPYLLHRDGTGRTYEHRELHNLYGMLMHQATHEGQKLAFSDRRPFVLTRAFFAGSQRYAAVWTGDNKASWAHLAASTPMLLTLSVAGVPFVGADVGGFFGNPTTALLVRWYQAAIFHPFLRAHAEFKTKRREPWLFGEGVTNQVRTALRTRYALLPYLYTLFAKHRETGALVMRPMWHEFPRDDAVRAGAWWAPSPPPKAEADAPTGAGTGAAATADLADDTDTAVDAAGTVDAAGEEESCECFKCSDAPCHPPACTECGPKESSGCKTVNGVPYPEWGCYTTSPAKCTCAAASSEHDEPDDEDWPRHGRGLGDEEEDDYRHTHYGDDDEYNPDRYNEDADRYSEDPHSHEHDHDPDHDAGDDDDAGEHGKTDYNAEYYHGDATSKSGPDDQDESQRQTAEQFLLGPHLLIQPVTQIDLTATKVYLPGPSDAPGARSVWYDFYTAQPLTSEAGARVVDVEVHADRVPAYVRGGAVLPTRERLRRSSAASHVDPFTLAVTPDAAPEPYARGELYLDGYDGFDDATHVSATFTFAKGVLTNTVSVGASGAPAAAASPIERVVFYGQPTARRVVVRTPGGRGHDVQVHHDAARATLTVRQPRVRVGEAWSMEMLA